MCAVDFADYVQDEAGADENACVLQLAQSREVRRGGCCSAVASPKRPVPSAWQVVCGYSAPCSLHVRFSKMPCAHQAFFCSLAGLSLTEGCGKRGKR